jgi:NAD(P)-dependent dehydrogenase (short-subunit alcohol dehydrogenase family)
MRFTDKVVLVVGGNSGIGLAAARKFAKEGARVIITGRNPDTLRAAEQQIPRAVSFAADIADPDAMTAVISACKTSHGRIDVLFVNAGVGAFAMIEEVTPELWDQVHAVNLRGCFFAIQQALPLLPEGAAIVITGSIGASAAVPGNVIYAAAKAGLRAMARILAKELVGRKIRVNVVSPGPTETPLINRNIGMDEAAVDSLRQQMIAAVPLARMGEPDEVADAVLFLASQDASFITGVDLLVDGGCIELG